MKLSATFPLQLALVITAIISMSQCNPSEATEKLVVTWIDWPFSGGDKNAYFVGSVLHENGNCEFSRDWSLAGKADAVLIFWPQTKWSNDFSWLNVTRKSHQKFVFVSDESAAHYPMLPGLSSTAFQNFFNWTMTYRLDSDIPWRYGWLSPNENADEVCSAILPKPKVVAQFVSMCHTPSRREAVVQKLKEYLHVDVYGGCGDKVCTKNDDEACREMLERDYYFYLAFENSACLDYVTEKLFYTLRLNVVPIVLARKIASAVVPDSSFIAVDDFKNLKELADYLTYLTTNLTAYTKYFDWKQRLKISVNFEGLARSLLCRALHNSSMMASKIIGNIYDWWNTKSACYAMPTPQ